MDDVTQILLVNSKLLAAKHDIEQLQYDLSKMEFLLGECMVLLDKVAKRANTQRDSFTGVWCEDMLSDIRKILDAPRFGVDIITYDQIEDTK